MMDYRQLRHNQIVYNNVQVYSCTVTLPGTVMIMIRNENTLLKTVYQQPGREGKGARI